MVHGLARPSRSSSVLWLIPTLVLLAYVIVRYIDDFEATPRGLLLALDHSTFIGTLTNAILGLLLVGTVARRSTWAWADQLVFWGLNLGLVGFVTGLIAESPVIKRGSTPIVGVAILLGLLTAAVRLREARQITAPVPVGETTR